MNAIRNGEQPNHTNSKVSSSSAAATATNNNARRRHTYIGTINNTSEVDTTAWKQNAVQSQV